jgi:broad specificity phosphatase PhoE
MNDAPERAAPMNLRPRRRTAILRFLGVAVASIALLVGAAVPAAAAELMRVTFVRHGESAGNASGLIDTSTPGPVLTPLGQQQSRDVVGTLGDNNYDAIYASTMVRTQLTAAPMSQYLRLPIQVLPGLQEIEAGVFEGTPESEAANGYAKFPLAWTFQGNRDLRIPGSINGHEFDARMDGALQKIYDNGDRNAVVFSHGGAIMFWTMMNVQNLTLAQKIDLLRTAALGNTDYVVIEGNPEDGWTLVNWNGQQFTPEPTLAAEVQLQMRTLTRQLAATANQVAEAFATGNIATILTAINRGIADAAFSIAKFGRAVNAKLIGQLDSVVSPPASSEDSDVTSTTNTMAANTPEAAVRTTPAAPSGDDDVTSLGDREPDPIVTADPEAEAIETDEVQTPEPEASIEEDSEKSGASDGATDANDAETEVPVTRETSPAGDASPDSVSDDASTGQNDAADAGDDGDDQQSDAA